MPTYDYECTKCGHTFDAFQSMSEDPLVKCPNCGKNGLRRLIGGGLGVIFKGSGFYVTDSRRNGNGGGSSAKPASEGSSDSGSTSSDSGSSPDTSTSAASSKSEAKLSKAASGSKAK